MHLDPLRALSATALLAVSVVACSGGSKPPNAGDGPAGPAVDGGPVTSSYACTTEGAIEPCASLGTVSLDMVMCTPGTRKCAGGVWSACAPLPSATGDWYPSDAPCDACTHDGDTRVCKIKLPNQGNVHACATGAETCAAGYWGLCK
jgi:hypothetical protein